MSRNVNSLREILFDEITALHGEPSVERLEQARAKCEIADRIIDTMRVEVQLAAVMKGAISVPFIEGEERRWVETVTPKPVALPQPEPEPDVTPETSQTKSTWADELLRKNAQPDHPWRKSQN